MGYLPKDYVWVDKRIEKYHSEHTDNMSIDTTFEISNNIVIFKATVKTKKGTFTWSSFWQVGKEKAFEKLETVAVGRALAFAWYETTSWIASREEMENFEEKIDDKPWFNNQEFAEFRKYADRYTSAEDAIKKISIKYKISNKTKKDIENVYAELENLKNIKK